MDASEVIERRKAFETALQKSERAYKAAVRQALFVTLGKQPNFSDTLLELSNIAINDPTGSFNSLDRLEVSRAIEGAKRLSALETLKMGVTTLTADDRWLQIKTNGDYIVYSANPSMVIYIGKDEEEACRKLLNMSDENEEKLI